MLQEVDFVLRQIVLQIVMQLITSSEASFCNCICPKPDQPSDLEAAKPVPFIKVTAFWIRVRTSLRFLAADYLEIFCIELCVIAGSVLSLTIIVYTKAALLRYQRNVKQILSLPLPAVRALE